MEDLIVIDGRKDFKRIYLQQFVETLDNESQIFIDYGENKSMSCNKDNLLEKLFSDELLGISEMETEINIYSDNAAFIILRSDLDWWNTTRRKNILKEIVNSSNKSEEQEVKEEVKETSVKSKNRQMRVAIADLTEEGLCHIDICEASKTECLKWLNNQVTRHYDLAGKFIQVFNLDFKDEDVNDIDKWKTAKELADEGKVKLQ